MDSTKLFTQTHPVKLFFTASIPGAVSMLASSLYQTLDGVFVGQFIGPTAFAAINLAMPFVIINFSLARSDRRWLFCPYCHQSGGEEKGTG